MKIMEKVKNLISPMKWVQGFLLNKFAKKFITGAVVSALAYLGPHLTKLSESGIKVDVDAGAAVTAIIALIGGILNGLANTAKHGPLKTEGDVPTAGPAQP